MDRQRLRLVLEKVINRHYEKEMYYKLDSKKFKSHENKRIKHMHKRHELIELAEKCGFHFCKCCGNLK